MSFVNRYLNNPIGGDYFENPGFQGRWEVTAIDDDARPHGTRIFKTKEEAERAARIMRPDRPGWIYLVHRFPTPHGKIEAARKKILRRRR